MNLVVLVLPSLNSVVLSLCFFLWTTLLLVLHSSNRVLHLFFFLNKILRILQFKSSRTHVADLCTKYNTLQLNVLLNFKLLLFTHNWIYTTCKRLPQCLKLCSYQIDLYLSIRIGKLTIFTWYGVSLIYIKIRLSIYVWNYGINYPKILNLSNHIINLKILCSNILSGTLNRFVGSLFFTFILYTLPFTI